MSESSFRLFNAAFPIGAELLYAACLALFLRPFLGARQGRKAAALFSAHIALSLAWEYLPAFQGSFSLLVTGLLAAAAKPLGIRRAWALLLGLLFWNAKIASALTAESLYFLAGRLFPQPSGPDVYLRAALLLTLLAVCQGLVLGPMLAILGRQLKKRPLALHPKELCSLCLTPGAGILFGQVMASLLIEVKDGILLELYERHPAFLAVVPALALLFYTGSCLTISFQQGLDALREERERFFVERQQTRAIQERIQEVERLCAQVQGFKHELRGHLSNLKGLAAAGEYHSLDGYLTKMDSSIQGFALSLHTGNPVSDVIISGAQRRAQQLGVRFQADFRYPPTGGYEPFEVGIILQNLLQNALEACEAAKEEGLFITLAGKQRGRFFLIEVRNSFQGQVIFRPDGLPATRKTEDAPLHGIGLANVRREAEKYLGDVEIQAEGREFSVTVLLQEKHSQGG